MSRRVVLAAIALLFVFPYFACAGPKVPEGKKVFINDSSRVYYLENDPLTGWPTAYPVFSELHRWSTYEICVGPDGFLYFSDTWNHRVIRCAPDGSSWTVIVEDPDLYPAELAFDDKGNLFFSTTACKSTKPRSDWPKRTQGIWMISDVLTGTDSQPQCVIPAEAYEEYFIPYDWCRSPELRFLHTGPYEGGLLTGNIRGCPALCVALGPSFSEYVPFFKEGVELPFSKRWKDTDLDEPVFVDEVVSPEGTLFFAAPYDDKIFQFASDGAYEGVFAEVPMPFRITADSEGFVYVVTHLGKGVTILAPNGTPVFQMSLGTGIEGIAVIEEHPADTSQSEAPSPSAIATGNVTLLNDTGSAASGLKAVFDQPITITHTSMSDGLFFCISEDDGSVVTFGGGVVEVGDDLHFSWEPADAQLLRYEWLSIPTS